MRLRDNRDFQLLWSGQVISHLGSRVSSVALPLLVLDLTASASDAGLVRFAGQLPLILFMLPAGALLDVIDRRRVMLGTELVRAAGFAWLAATVAFGTMSFAQIVAVAAISGVGYAFFEVAQRAALRQLVPPAQRASALVQNEVRDNFALIAGQALGGVLYSVSRILPFAADALSYVVSFGTVALIRSPLQEARQRVASSLRRELGDGVVFLWREPFLRTTQLLVTGSDLVVNALYLVVIVVAREQGATATEIGWMVAWIGIGGLIGSALAAPVRRRLSVRGVVVWTMAVPAALTPLLLVASGPLALGVLYGAMFLLHPTWSSTIGPYRTGLVPDSLQARFQSASLLLGLGLVPLGSLAAGWTLDAYGSTTTIVWLSIVMFIALAAAVVSGSVRRPPALESATVP